MRHYAHITANYVAKNKAHEEASKLASQYNKKLIKSDDDLKKLKLQLEASIADINAKHPRIKHKVKLDIFRGYPGSTATWHIGDSVILSIEPVVCDLEFDIHE